MLKKKRICYTFLIVSIVGVLVSVMISSLGVRIAGRCEQYIDGYNGYYLYKKEYNPLIDLNFGTKVDNGYKIWFVPGQKRKLLEKIKEDVNAELTNVVANNSDIFRNYEISDDFRNIYIYHYKGAMDGIGDRFDEFARRVASKVELYHQLIHGYVNTSFGGNIINNVEVE